MNCIALNQSHQADIITFFSNVFSDSEGPEEGKLIGQLVSHLCPSIDDQTTLCFAALEGESIIGAIFFTKLFYDKNTVNVYMLAPVAVSTEHQGQGVGQQLINAGLNILRARGVDVVVTYGDPGFYTKVGFQPLSESMIQAPLKLSMPEGWIGQSLTEQPINAIDERPSCVDAFNNPIYW